MDRLDGLRAFIAVADKGSFTEAARTLNVSGTAATRAIAALEASLGVSLFMRTTRSVRLTEEGAAYLERCRAALTELDDAAEMLRGRTSEPRGTLVVTAPVVFGRLHILPVVTQLLRRFPALDVRLMLIDRVVPLVDEGIDVAVRIADLSDSALHALRVAQVRRVLTASPDYLAQHGEPTSATQLHEHALISFDQLAGANNEWRFSASGKPAVRITPRLTVNSADAAIAAARAGLGIVRTLSYQVAEDIAAGRLKPLLVELEPPPVPVNLVFQASRRSTPNVRAFLDTAKVHFANGVD
ncbi:MAG: LysR family transcriptional regulator [Cupriavidus sp.]|nr:MAG: LysR family transcriptional regulator [Cupriavidus sp.]